MRDQSWDCLEEYIAGGDIGNQKDTELAELCQLVDEIRALNPKQPDVLFAERIADGVVRELPRPQKGFFGLALPCQGFRPIGWASALVAALLLITMGVLPHKSPVQQELIPVAPAQEETKNLTADSVTPVTPAVQKPSGILPAPFGNSSEDFSGAPAGLKTREQLSVDASGQQEDLQRQQMQAKAEANNGGMVKKRMQAANIAVGDQTENADKLPFRVLTIPERSPVSVKVENNPPSITMVYMSGSKMVTVRQGQEASSTIIQNEPEQMQIVRRDLENTVIEVSGDVEKSVLDEILASLQ